MEVKDLPRRRKIKETVADIVESPIEGKLMVEFYRYGLYPEAQYEVSPYRVDFAFLDKKIIVECDGARWYSTPEQREKDKKKDEYVQNKGWIVRRFSGSEIHEEPWNIAKEIIKYYYPLDKRPQTEYEKYWVEANTKNNAWRQALKLVEPE